MDRGMQYRPEYRLDRLRMMRYHSSICSSNGRRAGEPPLLHLRWLRTMVVDPSHTAETIDVGERLALQQRSAIGGAVERVVCKQLTSDQLSRVLPFLTQRLLTSLDLRGCKARNVNDDFLLAVADAHSSSLRRLYLPEMCSVAQSTLDRFTQLEELDATWCKNLTDVDFCSATLRVLYANHCSNLTDAGLRRAARLEVLHVGSCQRVTDMSAFAHCLLELDASKTAYFSCGIGSAALSDCRRLQVLLANGNKKITTVQRFAQRLRELNAGWCCALDDAALADATGLVRLSAHWNGTIATVESFGASLLFLVASNSMIGDAGLVTATNLVYLDASDNDNIHSMAPFSGSLLELRARGRCISETALSAALNLIWLDVSYNTRITLVQSCGRSLRHLVARGASCALTDKGLSTATLLVTLNSDRNSNLTLIARHRSGTALTMARK